ncbi:nucleotidyl transferase AbiEii/AbiGii toxin family protein [Candidatus Gracilibacteria bacterium]|nr:nucleotidyl transferase AbiEii/AbiGii toxin family protein [Candidatus Gracilibacteria bacterium]
MMHLNILSDKQKELLPLLKSFSSDFYLAGGTAIALQLGHRSSIDFDLFTEKELKTRSIENKINRLGFKIEGVFVNNADEFTCLVNGVKVSFISFPFAIKADEYLEQVIKLPNLLILASMKAYALGRRAKWKDYVDMYFILRDYFSLEIITQETNRIFGGNFNSRTFREQLIWFKDIDYSEGIEFQKKYKVSQAEIEKFLQKISKL